MKTEDFDPEKNADSGEENESGESKTQIRARADPFGDGPAARNETRSQHDDRPNANSVEVPPEGGLEHFGDEAWLRLLAFAGLLEEEGEKRGIIGPRELERLWERHILNSTVLDEFIPNKASVADVGSGAGFPGIVLAIQRPDCNVVLVESMERRVEWLQFVTAELALDNVRVKACRAEDLHGKQTYDIVTARAVAALKKLTRITLPLVKPGGSLLALKGKKAEQEIREAIPQLKKEGAAWADIYDRKPFGTQEVTRILEVAKK